MNPVFAALSTTIFETMSVLCRTHDAINLGQGFPDDPGPADVREMAACAIIDGPSQYPPMMGLPVLRDAIVAHYARFQGLDLQPDETLVTSGATEALAAALLALISPGDEVVLIQPMYDAYLPLVLRAGGIPRLITLTPPHWRLTEKALAGVFGPRTRLIVVNTPMNPTAHMFRAEELTLLARFCIAHDCIALCDEVWEHVVFDDRRHHSLFSLPGMRDRTIKIGSAGKIFSMTGWKVGFACAAPPLLAAVARAHQFLAFTTPPALQSAVAYGLGKDDDYFVAMRQRYQRGRDRLSAGLRRAGYVVLPSEGAYFVCVDLAASGIDMADEVFCRRAVIEAGVGAIPLSAFYAQDKASNIIRLCCAKYDETLDRAIERLEKARRLLA